MKNKLFFIAIFLNFYFTTLVGQSFEWAKRAGWYAFDLGYAVGADAAGNVYISGKYELNASFGNTHVSCAGNHDIYLAKYGPDGSFKWVRTAGGPSGDYTHAIACDAAGNSYITGEIEQTVHFGSVTITGNGSNDVFVAKYNTNGDLVWVKKLGGSHASDKGLGITLSAGNVYVTGFFQGTANFAGTTLSTAGGEDIFIAKYSLDGAFQWVKRAGGSGNDEGTGISGDSEGNIYVTGFFANTANFGGSSVTSGGGSDMFIARYNSSGTCIWVKRIGNKGMDYGYGVAADNSGRIFVTGGFRYTTLFGSTSLKASGGHADMFVTCFNSSGNVIWAKRGGGNYNDYGRAIAADNSSNVYITGNYGFTADFGGTTISGADSAEIYFASYDASGNFRWVLRASGVADDSDPDRFIEMGLSICVDPNRNVFASGAYRSASTFGSTTLSKWDHTEVYVTKIRQGAAMTRITSRTPIITPSGSASFCTGGNVLLTATEDTAYQYYLWKKNNVIIDGAEGASYEANAPGSYAALIISGTDTITSAPTVITESRSITASISPSGPIVCKDSAIVLTANAGYGYIYQWKRDGVAIPGATSQTLVADKSGNYQVKIIQGSCLDWSAKTKVTLECLKPDTTLYNSKTVDQKLLKAEEDSLIVKVYPNPNNGLFILEINMANAVESEQVKIELVNAVGQVVYRKLVSENNGYVNEHVELESNVPIGIYFLQITVGNQVETTRMMLTK